MKGTSRRTRNIKRRREVFSNKMIMLILAVSIAIAAGVFGTSNPVDAHDTSQTETLSVKCYKSIELQEGDTLWGIAETYMDDTYESVDEYISELKRLNNLESDEIHEGCYLMVAYMQ